MITDLGASFGPTGLEWGFKGNVAAYCKSRWIRKVSPEHIDFNVPSGPAATCYINFVDTVRRLRMVGLGRHIPREDARWMGELLGRLSANQVRDAFRAAGYSPEDVEQLSRVVEQRVDELKRL
jgi:hypothetical protein